MKKRLLGILLSVCMVLTLLPGFTQPAMAAGEVTLLVNTSAADDSAARGTGARYKTLAGAVAKAVSGDTIKFETDCDVDATVMIEGTTLTLDLNDKLITCSVDNSYYTNYLINVGNGGTLTVTDTANGLGKMQYASPITVTSNGTVNIARGTIEAASAGNGPAIQCGSSIGTVNVSGGTVTLDIGGSESYGAINSFGTVNVSGGTVVGTGATPAIKSSGTVNVSGGTINSLSSLNGSTANVTGGNIGLFRIISGTAYVTGGSINTINNDGTLQNLDSQSLRLYVFTGGDPDTAVSSLSVTPDLGYTYGLNDVKTDSEGRIYVWLPAGKTNASVTAGGKTMSIDFRIHGEEITGLILPYPGAYGQTFAFYGTGYSGQVKWSPSATPFLPGTVYTGTFILTAVDSYTFTGMTGTFTVNGATSVTASDNTGSTLKLTVVFPETVSPQAVTVAVKRNGDVWAGHGKSLALYKDGINAYTLDSSGRNASVLPGTYNIYVGTTDTGVNITVSKGGVNSAEVNYYSVTLFSDMSIAYFTGDGTYLCGETAIISATPVPGYTWDRWSDDDTTMTNRSIIVTKQIDLTASATLTPATEPTITGVTGASLTYGYTSGSVSVAATAADGHTITGYQWYSNSANSNAGGSPISGATSASCALATGKAVGTTEYYYCVVTSTRADNNQTATAASGVATVTVGKADGSGSVSIDGWTYGGTAKTPTPASATNGTGHVTYIYEGIDPTSYTTSTTAPANAGTYKVTATFAATASYKECTATDTFTIAPQPVTKPTADTTSFVYTGSEQTYPLTENALYTITGNKCTNVGDQTVTAALKDKANYVWATNNNTTDLTYTFTITKAPVSFAVSGNTHDYDAAEHTATVAQTAEQAPSVAGNFTVTYQKDTETATANETNVGVYKIIVTLTDNNFKFEGKNDTVRSLTLTDKLTISAVAYPGAGSITLPTAGSLTYGATLSSSALTGGDAKCTYAWKTGTTIPTVTNTGYAVVCTPNDTNYAPFEKTASITVSKAAPTLTLPTASAITYGQKLSDSTLTGGSAGATYNGTANTNVPGAYSWSAGTAAPKVSDSNLTQYEVTFTPTDMANYSTATGKITLTVNPKPVTLAWDYTTPFTYDGAAKAVAATVSNKVGADTFTLAYSDNSKTNAGSYTAEVTALGNSNYTLTGGTNVTKDWSIAKAPISFAVSDNSYTYDVAAHTATVAQTVSTPVIATDKYTVTYKLPADGSGTADKTDVGVYDAIVTLSDDNFCFAGESDAATRSHKVGKLTIVKNTVTALWKNTSTVYDGTAKSPVLELVGLKAADTGVTARLTESETNAGTYAVTAELTGTKSGNYTLTNPIGTFIIQRAPVSFALTGNSVKKGDGVSVTAAPSVPGISATLTYWKSGKQVAAPTETGSYDIYAAFSDLNYRHAGGTGGSAQKIGVLTIYDSSAPTAYAVSFDANGGAGSTASMDAVETGAVRILPECGFTNTGKLFSGWQYNGKTYRPGERFMQPSANVTLKALWNDKVYSIGGVVQEGDPASNAANVVVTLMLGSRQIGQTVTGADGKYSFAAVVPGVYNLVANKNGVTQTVLVTIEDKAVADQTITMPTGKLNSVVEVKAGSPAIVVGDLEKAFTQQDKTDAASKAVELRLTAQAKAADSADSAQQEIEKKAGGVDLFLDFTLTRTIDGTSSPLDGSPVLLTAVITLPAELQGKDSYTVYRYHGLEVQTLTTTANKDGEGLEVSKDKTMLTVYTKNFSAYAIKGVTYSSGGASSCTLTFAVNGGSAITEISKTPGTTVDLSAYRPVRKGYTFAGWYSGANFATAIASVKLTANTTVYAKWIAKGTMPFTDVPTDAYYYDAILWALDKDITLGSTAALFNPDGICTRAQTVTFLWRAMGSPEPTATSCPFTDVIKNTYYYKAVLWATEKGITAGTSSTTFSPDATVTRGQTVTFLWRTADKPTVTSVNLFGDVESDAYYANAVLWAVSEGITSGTGASIFSPADGCTRAQIMTFLYRYPAK